MANDRAPKGSNGTAGVGTPRTTATIVGGGAPTRAVFLPPLPSIGMPRAPKEPAKVEPPAHEPGAPTRVRKRPTMPSLLEPVVVPVAREASRPIPPPPGPTPASRTVVPASRTVMPTRAPSPSPSMSRTVVPTSSASPARTVVPTSAASPSRTVVPTSAASPSRTVVPTRTGDTVVARVIEPAPAIVASAPPAVPLPVEPTPATPPLAVPTALASAPVRARSRDRRPIWIGAAAALTLVVGVSLVAIGSDEGSVTLERSRIVAALPIPPAPNPEPPPRVLEPPSLEPPPVEPPPTIESAEVVVADATPLLEQAHEPAPRKRARRRRQAEPPPQPVADAEPEPRPTPPPPRPKPKPPSAGALLAKAESALARGDADSAYRLASRSHAAQKSDAALALMARAACRKDDAGAAKSALKQLPLRERGAVRKDCRKNGSRIGL